VSEPRRDFSMTRTYTAFLLTSAVFAMFGCTDDRSEPDELIGEALSAVETDNALNPNALNPNALNPNALNPNALNPNALNPSALSPAALAAITDPGAAGDLSRQHLKYTVGCALDPTQSFSFSWTDKWHVVHQEIYEGLLGLATYWISKPLNPQGQQWVSACLAARTNYFGVAVIISSRGPCSVLNKHNTPEEGIYTKEEGAFWGNLYANPPALYACDVPANDANSRAQLRACAAGYIDPTTGTTQSCGPIQRLGSCDTYCTSGDPSLGHWACWTDPANPVGTASQQPITVFLQ
jgi:hypothetical protein